MSNPLSEEQIKKISEIAKLPQDQQQSAWNEFAKTLNEEQMEFLRSQQQATQCIFCNIADGSIESNKVYEDDRVVCVLDIKPANKGHVVVIPKKHYPISALMDANDLEYMFKIANDVAKAIFEVVNAQGTNILLSNGEVAGQLSQHVVVHVIPRFKDDKVAISWEGVKLTADEVKNVANQINSKMSGKPIVKEVKEIKSDQQPEGEEDLHKYNLDEERIP